MAEGARFELADGLLHLRFSRPNQTICLQFLKHTEGRENSQQERVLSGLEGLHLVAWGVRGGRGNGDTYGYTFISSTYPGEDPPGSLLQAA